MSQPTKVQCDQRACSVHVEMWPSYLMQMALINCCFHTKNFYGDPSSPTNYQAISILTTIGKLLERYACTHNHPWTSSIICTYYIWCSVWFYRRQVNHCSLSVMTASIPRWREISLLGVYWYWYINSLRLCPTYTCTSTRKIAYQSP